MGREAEQAIAHPIGQGADIEEQEHRCQETRERSEQPQEAEALLHTIPGTENHREYRQDREQNQERGALDDVHRVREGHDAEPRRRHQHVEAEQHGDANPR